MVTIVVRARLFCDNKRGSKMLKPLQMMEWSPMPKKLPGSEEPRNWGWSARLIKVLNNDGVALLFVLAEGPGRYTKLASETGLGHPTLDRKLQGLLTLRIIDRRRLPEEKRDWNEYFLTRSGAEISRWLSGFESDRRQDAVAAIAKKKTLNNFTNSHGRR